ncbi:alpha/beta fold hydrolase [Noviherbaspirillum sp. Root189]|uniref:alpha/beta fold hydrolase n=1 Tax=Noviherbaspirillum sp. Root189 TaxID=1736487 RepID=UPI000709AA4A|nr:alpha/beta hydrolase [Noviherbaspirillum sp. Root189]KRB93557.1 hypothetical protein ASE07_12740 [Noviherbaspirillum sp. Root189]
MKTFNSPQGPITYTEQGSGTPVILVHGIQGTARTWDTIVPALARHYRVIAPNLRGRGGSHAPGDLDGYRLECFADDLRSVLDVVAEPAAVVAWSMGVSVVLEMIRKWPAAMLNALILVSGTAHAGVQARWFHGGSPEEVEQEASERAARLNLVETATPLAVAGAWRSVQQADYRNLLCAVTTPTMVLHGALDDQCPISHGRLIAAELPRCVLHEWSHVGHNPMTADPGRFVAEVHEFIGRQSQSQTQPELIGRSAAQATE